MNQYNSREIFNGLYMTVLILDSLFFARKLTHMCESQPHNEKLMRITSKAWCRHWRRIQKAIDAGVIGYQIPTDALKDCNK